MTGAFGKPDATGRSSGIRSGRDRKLRSPPKGEPWCWLTRDLIASDAWRALSPNGRKFIDFLLVEDMNHAGTENGNLIATYQQLADFGLSRRLISEAIRECHFFGLVRVEEKGWRSGGGTNHPSIYRLTFYADKNGAPATNEWKGVNQDRIDEWKHGRRRMRKTGVGPGIAVNGTAPPGRYRKDTHKVARES